MCHGNKDDCGSLVDPYKSVVPVTKNLLLSCTTLDSDRTRQPDVVGDIGDPALRLPHSKYDIIMHVRCPWWAYMTQEGATVDSAVDNVVRHLRPGGLFVFDFSLMAARAHNARFKVVPEVARVKRLTSKHRAVHDRIHLVGKDFASRLHKSLTVISDDSEELLKSFVGLGIEQRQARDAVERVRESRRIVLRKKAATKRK
jgi:SAM-dependent methyltransferase